MAVIDHAPMPNALHTLGRGGVHAWNADRSTFDRRTLGHLVEHIDAHPKTAPSRADMAPLVGLSPSHFARKLHDLTGMTPARYQRQCAPTVG